MLHPEALPASVPHLTSPSSSTERCCRRCRSLVAASSCASRSDLAAAASCCARCSRAASRSALRASSDCSCCACVRTPASCTRRDRGQRSGLRETSARLGTAYGLFPAARACACRPAAGAGGQACLDEPGGAGAWRAATPAAYHRCGPLQSHRGSGGPAQGSTHKGGRATRCSTASANERPGAQCVNGSVQTPTHLFLQVSTALLQAVPVGAQRLQPRLRLRRAPLRLLHQLLRRRSLHVGVVHLRQKWAH